MKYLRAVLAVFCLLEATGGLLKSFAQSNGPIARATFNSDGSIDLPMGYRQWHHIGTRYKPIGVNILDGQVTKTPEIFNAYVEPSAFAAFEKTGIWPDGTQIVKEFSSVRIGEGCDEKTALCSSPLGAGIYESGYIGLGMMVKDVKRFPEGKGNWGYFSFGHKPPPYDSTSMLNAPQQCESCHVNLASDTDYVITRAHIGVPASGFK